jgi:hypothetical protein
MRSLAAPRVRGLLLIFLGDNGAAFTTAKHLLRHHAWQNLLKKLDRLRLQLQKNRLVEYPQRES